eukprot:797045_1
MSAIKVAIRVRPFSTGLCDEAHAFATTNKSVLSREDGEKWMFDYVFNDKTKTNQIYVDSVHSLVVSFLDGYNATVLAYGQTGTGKTYTMGCSEQGIIQCAIRHIFKIISGSEFEPIKNYRVECSYVEVYNNQINDLLDPDRAKSKQLSFLKTRATRATVITPSDCNNALSRGRALRSVGRTSMNAQSSRSHAVFTIHFTRHTDNTTTSSKFHFVDLAGSERVSRTKATGSTFKEATWNNKGLLTLGKVIDQLIQKQSHISFRDSMLTRLLQDSLGGNSMTLMIVCISAKNMDKNQTKNTLRFASRALCVKNKPKKIVKKRQFMKDEDDMKQNEDDIMRMREETLLKKQEDLLKKEESLAAHELRLKEIQHNLNRKEDTLLRKEESLIAQELRLEEIKSILNRKAQKVRQTENRLIAAEKEMTHNLNRNRENELNDDVVFGGSDMSQAIWSKDNVIRQYEKLSDIRLNEFEDWFLSLSKHELQMSDKLLARFKRENKIVIQVDRKKFRKKINNIKMKIKKKKKKNKNYKPFVSTTNKIKKPKKSRLTEK